MSLLEPAEPGRGWAVVRRRRARDRGAGGRRPARGPKADARRRGRDPAAGGADAAGRARPRRARPARRLERAGRRHLARHRGPRRRARALPRARRLGADRAAAGRPRRSSCWPRCWRSGRAARSSASRPRAAAADRALRGARGRDRLRRRVPQRRRSSRCWWSPSCGSRSCAARTSWAPPRWRSSPRCVALIAAPRAQPRHAVVRLRDVGARDLVLEGDLVHVGPQLRRAHLAARRPRAAARARASAGLLEGREPRRLRRPGVAPLAGPLRGRRIPARQPAAAGALDPADQGLDPQPAHGPVHHRGLRARARHPAAGHRPDARRPLRPAAHAAPWRCLHGERLHAAARRRASAAARASTTGPTWPSTRRSTPRSPACRAPTTCA